MTDVPPRTEPAKNYHSLDDELNAVAEESVRSESKKHPLGKASLRNVPKRPGISETTLIAAGIIYCDYPEPGSIKISYWTAEGEITKFSRFRLPTAEARKYFQEPGTKVYIYYAPGFFRRKGISKFGLDPNSFFLPEGEFKTLSLLEAGVWAVGIPSFTVYFRDENGQRRLLRDLQVTLGKEKPTAIYYLGDNDTCTNFEFSRNAEFLASAVNPTKVFLPRIPIDKPKGIDDCREAMGAGFDIFLADIIRTAIELPRKIKAPEIALLLFERELPSLKTLVGVEREKQYDRIIKMCAAAQIYAKSGATARLCTLARELLNITRTEFKEALKEVLNNQGSAKTGDSLAQKLEEQAIATTQNLNAYYDEQRKEYALGIGPDVYQSRTEAQFKRDLRFRDLTTETIPGRNWSQIDIALRYFQENKFVNYVGPLAGKRCGAYDENGVRILVTSQARVIEPKRGDWAMLGELIVNLLGHENEPYGESQIESFYGWLKISYEAFCARRFQPGHALAVAGPVDCGKSLLQSLITEILGGRSAKAALFLQCRTDFNGELFGAEHLILEDEAASTRHKDRMALASSIKILIANRVHACHAKHRQIVNLAPWWRISISLNDRPERLLVLPPLTDDISDKIILLRASKYPMPMPAETAEQKEKFWQTLTAQLPGFLYWLVNDHQVDDTWRDTRFGIKAFHHPSLLTELEALSPAIALLGLIDTAQIWEVTSDVWAGTALELRALLMEHHKTAVDARSLLEWINACAQYLNDLAEMRPARVKRFRTHQDREFEIYRPS
jgi:hypothetical protein